MKKNDAFLFYIMIYKLRILNFSVKIKACHFLSFDPLIWEVLYIPYGGAMTKNDTLLF